MDDVAHRYELRGALPSLGFFSFSPSSLSLLRSIFSPSPPARLIFYHYHHHHQHHHRYPHQLRVYQFDKLGGGSGFGLFHPNGNEVLVDEGVWDLRTHRLLRTLPCQDGTVMKPDPGGDVLYTYRCVFFFVRTC